MAIDVVVVSVGVVFTCPLGVPLPLLLYPRGRGYKEGNRIGYNMIPIRTLSLLAYFTYILIDIIIYAWGSTPWSSGVFRMVGRVIVDPSLGLRSPCGVVPWVPILISKEDSCPNSCHTSERKLSTYLLVFDWSFRFDRRSTDDMLS
jgi:hypothetical protein